MNDNELIRNVSVVDGTRIGAFHYNLAHVTPVPSLVIPLG
jgi:hypothetical protein